MSLDILGDVLTAGFREPDLADVPTMLDDDADKKFKKGPDRP
jgi:hypothetical protein